MTHARGRLPADRHTLQSRYLLLALFSISGAASLTLQIVWVRWFRLVLGSSSYAISTVVAAFLTGLALGAWLAGRLGHRSLAGALRLYAWLELGVVVSAMLVPLGLMLLRGPFSSAYEGLVHTPVVLGLVTALISAPLLLPATMLMGATLPVLVGSVERDAAPSLRARWVGLLYGSNTVGAAAGAFVAGFVLIPWLGLRWTAGVALCAELVVAAVALVLARRLLETESSAGEDSPSLPAPDSASEAQHREPLLTLAVVVAGVASLGMEVAWARALVVILGSSTHALSLVLVAWILGLGLGALIYAWQARRLRSAQARRLALGWAAAAAGLVTLALLPLVDDLPFAVAGILEQSTGQLGRRHLLQFVLVLGLLLVPATLLGTILPAAIGASSADATNTARVTGRLYAGSTVGSVLGSLLCGFVVLPWLGIHGAIVAWALLDVALGIALLGWGGTRHRGIVVAATAVSACLLVALMPGWDRARINSGAWYYGRSALEISGGQAGQDAASDDEFLFYREGATAAVAVTRSRSGGRLSLRINGKADASTGDTDLPTQLLLGHVPMLLHGPAQRVLIVGLGSGMTLGAVRAHPVDAVDVLEISPEVLAAVSIPEWRPFNRDALRAGSGDLSMLLADARQHAMLSSLRYDVIISEPSNPAISGISNLFSVECLEAFRDQLSPGGVVCQWLQGYRLPPGGFQRVVRGFTRVFPHVSVWETWPGVDYLLVGSEAPLQVPEAQVSQRLAVPAVSQDLARIGISQPADLLWYLVASGEVVAPWCGAGPVHTDDSQWLEFAAARFDPLAPETSQLRSLEPLRQSAADARLPVEGVQVRTELGPLRQARRLTLSALALREQAPPGSVSATLRKAAGLLDEALMLRLRDHVTRVERARVASELVLALKSGADSRRLTDELAVIVALQPERWTIRASLAARLLAEGDVADALGHYQVLRRQRPDDPEVRRDLASLLLQQADDEAAAQVLEEVHALDPGPGDAAASLALIAVRRQDPTRALRWLDRALVSRPGDPELRSQRAAVLGLLGRSQEARNELEALLQRDPRNPRLRELLDALGGR